MFSFLSILFNSCTPMPKSRILGNPPSPKEITYKPLNLY